MLKGRTILIRQAIYSKGTLYDPSSALDNPETAALYNMSRNLSMATKYIAIHLNIFKLNMKLIPLFNLDVVVPNYFLADLTDQGKLINFHAFQLKSDKLDVAFFFFGRDRCGFSGLSHRRNGSDP